MLMEGFSGGVLFLPVESMLMEGFSGGVLFLPVESLLGEGFSAVFFLPVEPLLVLETLLVGVILETMLVVF